MRLLALALLALIVSVGLALLAQADPGYVLITRGEWAMETSLILSLLVLGLGFGVLYLLLRTLAGVSQLPRRTRHWRLHRRARKARLASQRGLLELAEGRWAEAERHLARYAAESDAPLLNYLGAARAAQKQDAEQRRDYYLAQAHKSMPAAALAVGLTQAEVQLSHGQLEQALATLRHLRTLAPKHVHVLHLLQRLYLQLESWNDLAELLPDLRKHKAMPAVELTVLERTVFGRLLATAAATNNPEQLDAAWQRLPKARRQDGELVAQYAEALIRQGRGSVAERLLREAIKRQWQPRLVCLYGLVEGEDPARQLAHGESWLRDHERQPDLLLALGRIAMRDGLFGKARAYLEASVGVEPRPESYRDLGQLLERMNEPDKAAEYFRKGLEHAVPPAPRFIPRLEHRPA